jgi:hypothetical protein
MSGIRAGSAGRSTSRRSAAAAGPLLITATTFKAETASITSAPACPLLANSADARITRSGSWATSPSNPRRRSCAAAGPGLGNRGLRANRVRDLPVDRADDVRLAPSRPLSPRSVADDLRRLSGRALRRGVRPSPSSRRTPCLRTEIRLGTRAHALCRPLDPLDQGGDDQCDPAVAEGPLLDNIKYATVLVGPNVVRPSLRCGRSTLTPTASGRAPRSYEKQDLVGAGQTYG